MAIELKNLAQLADENGYFTLEYSDGTTSTHPFEQRSLPYDKDRNRVEDYLFGGYTPLMTKDLPPIDKEPNLAFIFADNVTDITVRGGAASLAESAAYDALRLTKVLLRPNGIAWLTAQEGLAKTNPETLVSPTNKSSYGLTRGGTRIIKTAGAGSEGFRYRKDGDNDREEESGYNYDPSRGGPKYENSILELVRDSDPIDKSDEGLSNHTLLGTYFNVTDNRLSREDLIKSYEGGAHSKFGMGDTEIKRYKADPYNGYLQFFNKSLFSLRQGESPNNLIHNDYRKIGGEIDGKPIGKAIKANRTRIGLYNLGNPGTEINEGDNAYTVGTIDQLSATKIYTRTSGEPLPKEFKDYINFRIAVVDVENPLKENILGFRAFLDNLTDNYSGNWNGHKYNGRAEEFFTYSGFQRNISLGFKIHAQSRQEQIPLWNKLNYLVAQTAPEYKNRRMRGVYSRLTVGDWMYEIPGFFTSVNLSWNTNYPWEIRNENEPDVRQYPHILDISCEFQPIHDFAPSNSPKTPFIIPFEKSTSALPEKEDIAEIPEDVIDSGFNEGDPEFIGPLLPPTEDEELNEVFPDINSDEVFSDINPDALFA